MDDSKEEVKEKAIIECIKEYFQKCPYLNELARINVDFLDMDAEDFEYWSLEQMDGPIILKKNVLRTKTERQCLFILASRSFFNPLVDKQNIDNLHLFEKIAEWTYQNNRKKVFPILNDGEESISIEITSGGSLYGTNKDNTIARYQMEGKLIYEKKERNSIWH